jgi:hypothetical protein
MKKNNIDIDILDYCNSSDLYTLTNDLHSQLLNVTCSELKQIIILLFSLYQHQYFNDIFLVILQQQHYLKFSNQIILELVQLLCQLGSRAGFYTGFAISWMKLYKHQSCVDYLLSIGAKQNRNQLFCLNTDQDYINYCTDLYTNYGAWSTEIFRQELLQGKVVSTDNVVYNKTSPMFAIGFTECKLDRLIDILYTFHNFHDDHLLQTVVQYGYRFLVGKLFRLASTELRNDNQIILYAIHQNNLAMLQYLVVLGATYKIPCTKTRDNCILSIAIRNKNLQLVKFILQTLDPHITDHCIQYALVSQLEMQKLGLDSEIYTYITSCSLAIL